MDSLLPCQAMMRRDGRACLERGRGGGAITSNETGVFRVLSVCIAVRAAMAL